MCPRSLTLVHQGFPLVSNLQAYTVITGEEMEEIKIIIYQVVHIYTHSSLQLSNFDAKFGKRISSYNSL
jgi:hypothetical protein